MLLIFFAAKNSEFLAKRQENVNKTRKNLHHCSVPLPHLAKTGDAGNVAPPVDGLSGNDYPKLS